MPCTCAAIRLTTAITPTGISRRPAPLAHPLTDASTQLSFSPAPHPLTFDLAFDPASPISRLQTACGEAYAYATTASATSAGRAAVVLRHNHLAGYTACVPLTPPPPRVSVHCPRITYVLRIPSGSAGTAVVLSSAAAAAARRRPPAAALPPPCPPLCPSTPM